MFNRKIKKNIIIILTTLLSLGFNLFTLSPVLAANLTFNNIEVKKIDNDELTIAWSTNLPAQGWLQIREPKSGWNQTSGNTQFQINQEATVRLPLEKTAYYYKIIAENQSGQRIVSFEFNIRIDKFIDSTLPKFNPAPRQLYSDNSQAIIIWATNEKTKGKLKYSLTYDLDKAKSVNAKVNKDFNAKATISNLRPNTTYYYEVIITDDSGNQAKSAVLTFATRTEKDNEDLRILKQQPLDNNSSSIKDISVNISWQISRPSVCELHYGLKNKGKKKIKETGWGSLDHEFLIEGLTPDTEYAYRIYCTDVLNKKLNTEDIIFATSKPRVLGYEMGGEDLPFYGQKYGLVKSPSSPRIYAIVKKQKYPIKTPDLFLAYGFSWSEVKTITDQELNKYPEAKLVKTADHPAVYFLYHGWQRKKALLTETAFKSYRNNSFNKVITVSQADLDMYTDIVLVKQEKNSTVYLLQNTIKRPIKNMTALYNNNLQYQPIGLVSQKDLDSYYSAAMLE